MRVAVIADIHGNAPALEAVLADISAAGADAVLNLGDCFSGPLESRRTAELLLPLGLLTVRGNHDRAVFTESPDEMGAPDRLAHDELGPEHMAWLRALPETAVFEEQIFLCHGTPRSDEDYWLEGLDGHDVIVQAPLADIEALAAGLPYPVLLCGHSHQAKIIQLGDGRIVVNPGSVGCPLYSDRTTGGGKIGVGSPLARYALVERRGADWRIALQGVPYDNFAAAQRAENRGNRDWAEALRTGWIT